ncbi:hypothetical protein [Streptomyces cyaneofuscatus]|uniref:hypothetical protein n=1 Tax=Streptomyces cyaneofuscatus TaxID=66883 RepID=UPI0037B0B77F
MSTDISREIPGFAETRIAAAGEAWDAVRTNRFLGLQAVERLGSTAGPVIVEPTAVYFLVPASSTSTWDVPQSTGLSETHYVVLPAQGKTQPPGPYWLLPPRRPLGSTDELRRVLEAVQGPRPTETTVDLARLTLDQVRGLACALCGTRLYADRPLGTFTTSEGLCTEPTELWACAPTCSALPPR